MLLSKNCRIRNDFWKKRKKCFSHSDQRSKGIISNSKTLRVLYPTLFFTVLETQKNQSCWVKRYDACTSERQLIESVSVSVSRWWCSCWDQCWSLRMDELVWKIGNVFVEFWSVTRKKNTVTCASDDLRSPSRVALCLGVQRLLFLRFPSVALMHPTACTLHPEPRVFGLKETLATDL